MRMVLLQWKVKVSKAVSKQQLYGTTTVPYRNRAGYYDRTNFFDDCFLTCFEAKIKKT